MSKEKLNNLIDKVIGKDGPLRVPAYWMNKLFKDVGERVSATEGSIAEVDLKVDAAKASIPTKVSQLENDAELASKYNLPHWCDVSFDQEGEFISLVPFSLSAYKGYFESGYLRPDDTTDGSRYEFLCVLDENSVLGYYSSDYPSLASKGLTLGVYKITLEFIGADCVFHHLEKLDTVGGVRLLTYRNSEDNPTILLDGNSGTGIYYKGCPILGNNHIPDGFGEHMYVDFGGRRNFSKINQLIRIKSSDRIIGTEFKGNRNLLAVDFIELEEMASSAFEDCYGLQTANLGTKLKDITNSAFYGCSSLTSVTIPNSVTTIGKWAFRKCSSLTSVTIPNSVTTIEEAAFSSCNGLTSVTIPDSVTGIGRTAFGYCDSLTSVIIRDGVTTIGENSFIDNKALTSVIIGDGVTTIGNSAFSYCSSLTGITIPNSVTTIGDSVFEECESLTSVIIGDSVTTIGGRAFIYCGNLTSITIPNSVTKIGEHAFGWCDNLTEFSGKFASEDGRCLIVDGVLNSFAPYGLTEYIIPDSVTMIRGYVFSGCDSLTSVIIPDSVTTIMDRAFYECNSLASITIPDSVTTIGKLAFDTCDSLTEFNGSGASLDGLCIINNKGVLLYFLGKALTKYIIPDGAIEILNGVFVDCSLTSITIPDSVTTIGYNAFYRCRSLTSVYCKATTPPVGGFYMFDRNASDRKIYVPMESVDAYKSATYWRDYADAIVGYDFENNVPVE